MENSLFGGIVNFFQEVALDFGREMNLISDKVSKSTLFTSDLDLHIAQIEPSLHGQPFGPILNAQFLENFITLVQDEEDGDDYWSRSGPKFFQWIGIDYGRSHYFFTEDQDIIPVAVHENIFCNRGNKTEAERLEFFSKLGIDTTDVLSVSSSVTPTRSNLLARVKFEMLKNYFISKGKTTEEANKLSLIGMGMTTQHGLKQIKFKIIDAIIPNNPDYRRQLGASFCFFQTNFYVEDNQAKVGVNFTNYIPNSGCWQAHALIPTDSMKAIRASFEMNLEKEGDLGEATIFFEGDNPHYNKIIDREAQLSTYGILNANTKTITTFKDTSPTW